MKRKCIVSGVWCAVVGGDGHQSTVISTFRKFSIFTISHSLAPSLSLSVFLLFRLFAAIVSFKTSKFSCLLFCIVCSLQFSHFQLWHLNIQVQLLLYFFFEIINVVGFFPSLSRPNISKSLYLLYAIWLPVRFLYRFISILVLLSFLSHCLVHC